MNESSNEPTHTSPGPAEPPTGTGPQPGYTTQSNQGESVALEDPWTGEGSGGGWALGRSVWLASLGALQAAQGEGVRVFKNLVERGIERETQAPSEAAREHASSRRQAAERPSGALARLGVPTHDDAEHLASNTERLSENIEQLSDHIEHLSEHVEPLADRLTDLTRQTQRLAGQVDRLSERISRLETTTEQLEDSTETIETAVAAVRDKVPGM